MNRRIAITVWLNDDNEFTSECQQNIDRLAELLAKLSDSVEVFSNSSEAKLNGSSVQIFPAEVDTEVKSKNYVIQKYKNEGFSGKLHVINYDTKILKDPSMFINDIENMLDVFDLHSWLSTVTDPCNYLYKKYVPRLKVPIDKEMHGWSDTLKMTDVLFCSHSNTAWMIFDIGNGDDSELHFDDSFTVAMFWIIEYLARRRNSHQKSLYFMNEYVTCPSEKGVFVTDHHLSQSSEDALKKKGIRQDQHQQKMNELFKADDEKFRSMKIDYHPDNNLDVVLERTYLKLKEKFEQLENSKGNSEQ